MRRTLGLLSMAAALVVTGCDDDDDNGTGPEPEVYRATLSGANESPPIQTNAQGTATFTVDGNEIDYVVTITNWPANTTVSGAHIHFAPVPPATTGGVLLGFPTTGAGAITATGGSGTIAINDTQLATVRAGGTYYNVHGVPTQGTTGGVNAPGGLIRGNLVEQ